MMLPALTPSTKKEGQKPSLDGGSYYDPGQVNPSVYLLSPRATPS